MSTPTQIMSLADHLARTGQPVEAETCPALSWTPFASYGFAREFLSVPVVLAELHQTACAMPILFASHGGALYPAALLRLQDEADTRLITETGDWSGIYVPGLLRAHPLARAARRRGGLSTAPAPRPRISPGCRPSCRPGISRCARRCAPEPPSPRLRCCGPRRACPPLPIPVSRPTGSSIRRPCRGWDRRASSPCWTRGRWSFCMRI